MTIIDTPEVRAVRSRPVIRADRRAKALEMRRAGCSLAVIGDALGISESASSRLIRRALRSVVGDPAQALIEQEIRELEMLREKAMRVLDVAHPLVSAGAIVHDVLRNADGSPIMDPRTNEPMRMPLHDSGPVLRAIHLLKDIAESRRRLLGVDRPTKLEVTGTDPVDVLKGMSQDRIERALALGLERLRRPVGIIDVTPRATRSEPSEPHDGADA
jgi:hypothetical protein